MQSAYQAILNLYPAEYKAAFGEEMMDTFAESAARQKAHGALAFRRFLVMELAGLLRGVWTEWIAKWSDRQAYITSRCVAQPDSNLPTDLAELQIRLRHALYCMEYAIAHHDFPKARFYSDQERVAREQLGRLMQRYGLNRPLAD